MQTPASDGRPPVVRGYVVGRLLGFGGHGEVWSAREERSGEQVALKIIAVGPAGRARVLRESTVMRRIDHRHVVRLRSVVDLDSHGVALVLDHAQGGSLAALVATRGALDPGEVITVLSPLASALADLHARGLVHADVTPGNVLFAGDGRPLLSDLGVASLVGLDDGTVRAVTPGYADPAVLVGGQPTPATDVYGLSAVAWFALTGRAPQPSGSRPPLLPLAPGTPAELAALVEQGLDVDPHRRPAPAQLAVRAYDAAPATPVRLVQTDPGAAAAEVVTHRLRAEAKAAPAVAAARSRPGRRRVAGVAAVVLALAVAGGAAVAGPDLVGWEREVSPAAARPAAPTAAAVPTSGTTSDAIPAETLAAVSARDPAGAVPALARLRALAFSTGDSTPLDVANVAGSPALQADRTILESLAADALRLEGLYFEVRSIEVVTADEALSVVDVSVVTGEHRRVSTVDGSVASVQPASEPRVSRLTLQRVDGRWQVSKVG